MDSLAVCVKEVLSFAQDLPLFNWLYFIHLVTSFSSINHFVIYCGWFFVLFHPAVLSINPSANTFVFGGFNVHHKDWLTFPGGIDGPGELL